MKKLLIIIAALSGLVYHGYAQDEYRHLKKGNELYEKGVYPEAVREYSLASDLNHGSFEAAFNQGNAWYRQDSLEKAASQFQLAANLARETAQEAMAWHNLGNTYLQQKNYKQSIDAYKQALRKNPQDDDTRYNLAYARKMLEDQQNQQDKQNKDNKENKENKDDNKQNQNDDKSKDDQKQENKQQKNSKEQEQKQSDEQNGQKDKSDPGKEQNQQQPNTGKGSMSREDAERLLNALEQDEEQLRKNIRLKEEKSEPKHIEKNW